MTLRYFFVFSTMVFVSTWVGAQPDLSRYDVLTGRKNVFMHNRMHQQGLVLSVLQPVTNTLWSNRMVWAGALGYKRLIPIAQKWGTDLENRLVVNNYAGKEVNGFYALEYAILTGVTYQILERWSLSAGPVLGYAFFASNQNLQARLHCSSTFSLSGNHYVSVQWQSGAAFSNNSWQSAPLIVIQLGKHLRSQSTREQQQRQALDKVWEINQNMVSAERKLRHLDSTRFELGMLESALVAQERFESAKEVQLKRKELNAIHDSPIDSTVLMMDAEQLWQAYEKAIKNHNLPWALQLRNQWWVLEFMAVGKMTELQLRRKLSIARSEGDLARANLYESELNLRLAPDKDPGPISGIQSLRKSYLTAIVEEDFKNQTAIRKQILLIDKP